MKAININPKSQFNTPHIRSDTLFGAICWGIRYTKGENELIKLLNQFKEGNPPFLISSIYPRKHDAYYLPKPKIPIQTEEPETFRDIIKIKNQKKIEWIEASNLNSFLNKERALEEVIESSESKKFYRSFEQVGNSVNRLTQGTEGKLFFRNSYEYLDGVGLYFLLKEREQGIMDIIKPALHFIEDRGIGGAVSRGWGQIDIEDIDDFDVIEPQENPRLHYTASLYSPTEKEWKYLQKNQDKTFYGIEKRKGIVEESFTNLTNPWKKTVFMLTEGSIIPEIGKNDTYGKNPIVNKEENEVQQYGYAFTFGIK
ncbi:type III-A CRISPR-associated RAMP protein Csm4 [Methanonatronarchaeum sp. AMET-Sl]|uniref:type III-A CRISPR-associated RAMP protein Csm4 n=1 Tax=Methanonatronarchaeum sp. AMET-Sl TaxID=3037654 RepID=UPI00244E14F4|nr:type III-A CRISPR-associated RAMP protein Csm4 [Methanonatronarchaeum sp. AMET-Sl]WGI17161.1 type III-A CRISPR-associated RAMP protein Csm4 [Methanonatronarchaeum sp. AMET-Sl]